MRILRLLALALLLGATLFAQYLFDNRSLETFFPVWLLDRLPVLRLYARWPPADLLSAALWLALLASLLFGLLVPSWPSYKEPRKAPAARPRGRALALIGAGILAAGGALLLQVFAPSGEGLTLALWLASLGACLAGSWLLYRPLSAGGGATPEGTALPILLLLAAAAFFFTLDWLPLPLHLDGRAAGHGLQALAFAGQAQTPLFAAGLTDAPGVAYLPLALLIRLTGDGLTAMRMLGLAAALLLVLATWLLGCELFRRPVSRELGNEQHADNGWRMALVAAGLVAVLLPTLHFGRFADLLPAVAVATLGLWALLRGLRLGDDFLLVLAGVLIGGAALLHVVGLWSAAIGLLWWVGVFFFRRTWLRRGEGGTGLAGFLLWLVGLFVMLAPVLGGWLARPGELADYASVFAIDAATTGPLLSRIQDNFLGLFWLADASTQVAFPGHLLTALVAPLFVLAVGALLTHLDRLIGWTLVIWLLLVILFTAVATTAAPFWPGLLLLTPAAALAVAFALDRSRVVLVDAFGPWSALGSFYVALGLLVAVAFYSWNDYRAYATDRADWPSVVGWATRAVAPGAGVLIVHDSGSDPLRTDDPVVRFLLESQSPRRALQQVSADQLPASLPVQTALLVPPDALEALFRVRERFPTAVVTAERDDRANPLVYRFTIR